MSEFSDNSRKPAIPLTSVSFFGAVTASVSHELNNVVSIIDQSAGLLDDLAAGAMQGNAIDPARLVRVAEAIGRQTERGIDIIRRLNRFAHSTDVPVCTYDLNEVVGNLGSLIKRLADMRQVEVSVEPYFEELEITGDPFLLQHVLFAAYALLLQQVVADDSIAFIVQSDQEKPVVMLEYQTAREDFVPDFSGLNELGNTDPLVIDVRPEPRRSEIYVRIA